MSDTGEELWLIALAADVCEGKPVDWHRAQDQATDPETEAILRGLKRLAGVVDAHRTITKQPSPPPLAAEHPKVWRHLLLLDVAGTGAFGTVYRAWDAQLEREVALKLITVAPARAPLTEAQHLGRIRHPNVVTVYGAEQVDEHVGIWMEFIEGETLAAFVAERGPMSAREVAGIGIDLCRALSALHSGGLLHRDVKPQNVMREVGGRIVLMDFSGSGALDPREGRTVLSGTPLYMAPELLDGQPAAASTDTYSAGVLLFYLFSGRLPVEGASLSDVRRAHRDGKRIRLRDLRPELPDTVVEVVERAAHPDPAVRYSTAGDLEHALAGLLGSPATQPASPMVAGPTAAQKPRRLVAALTVVSAALIIAMGALLSTVLRRPSTTAPLAVQLTIGPPYNSASWPRISPDGRLIVFGTLVDGRSVFWMRPLDATQGRPLANASALETPFWSPDSRQLAFFADGKLKTIDMETGRIEVLVEMTQARGGAWNRDGILLVATGTGLDRIGADGGHRQHLTTLDTAREEFQHGWPEYLPDGRHFLYLIRSRSEAQSGVYLGSLDDATRKRIMPAYSRVAYAPSGHLLFVRRGTLMAQSFDSRSGELVGEPAALAGPVKYHAASDAAFDVSENGVLLYRSTEGLPSSRLVLLDRHGRQLQTLTGDGFFREPRFAPDSNRVAVELAEQETPNADIWVFDIERRSAARMTRDLAPDIHPLWSPDGRRIVFSSKRSSSFDVYEKSVDRQEEERLLYGSPQDKIVEDWSRDGRMLAITLLRIGLSTYDLVTRTATQIRPMTTSANTTQAQFSPDATQIAYTDDDSGRPEVYVEPLPATGARWRVSQDSGAEPHWRADGRELIYVSADGWVMSVASRPGTSWRPAVPRRLFRVKIPDLFGGSDITITPDASRFVVNSLVEGVTTPPIHVVVNWLSLLKR